MRPSCIWTGIIFFSTTAWWECVLDPPSPSASGVAPSDCCGDRDARDFSSSTATLSARFDLRIDFELPFRRVRLALDFFFALALPFDCFDARGTRGDGEATGSWPPVFVSS